MPVSIKQKAGRAAEHVWTFWKRENVMGTETEKRAEGKKEGNKDRGNEENKER
jgi:hypothetical protein